MLRRSLLGICALAVSVAAHAYVVQSSPSEFQEKISRLSFQGHEKVLHIGGRPEDVDAIAALVPKGEVVAVSELPKAKRHLSNVRVSEPGAGDKFDHIFVEEVLTKQYKQQSFFNDLNTKLKPAGSVVLHLPDYKRGVIARVLAETWVDLQDFVTQTPRYLSYNSNQYQRMLKKSGLKVSFEGWHVETKAFNDKEDLRNWLKDNWVYCQDLTGENLDMFVSTFVDKYVLETKQKDSSPILWEQAYLNIEAHKVA